MNTLDQDTEAELSVWPPPSTAEQTAPPTDRFLTGSRGFDISAGIALGILSWLVIPILYWSLIWQWHPVQMSSVVWFGAVGVTLAVQIPCGLWLQKRCPLFARAFLSAVVMDAVPSLAMMLLGKIS